MSNKFNSTIRESLAKAYVQFKGNGIIDIGLKSALDQGVTEKDFIVVPECCMKEQSDGRGEDHTKYHPWCCG